MSEPRDPPRWRHDDAAPRAVRDALRGARGYRPTAAQSDAVARAVAHAVGAPPASLGSAASPGTSTLAAPVLGMFGVVGVGLCAAWFALRTPAPRAPTAAPPAVAARALPSPPPAPLAQPAPAPDEVPLPPSPAPSSPSPACTRSAHEARVQAAQRALREGLAPRALALADTDRARCPRGPLAEERERVAIEALARGGQRAAAEARWVRFQRSFPESLYARRLRSLLGNGAAP